MSCLNLLQPEAAAKLGASQLAQPLTEGDGLPSGFLEDLAAKLEPADLSILLETLSKSLLLLVAQGSRCDLAPA